MLGYRQKQCSIQIGTYLELVLTLNLYITSHRGYVQFTFTHRIHSHIAYIHTSAHRLIHSHIAHSLRCFFAAFSVILSAFIRVFIRVLVRVIHWMYRGVFNLTHRILTSAPFPQITFSRVILPFNSFFATMSVVNVASNQGSSSVCSRKSIQPERRAALVPLPLGIGTRMMLLRAASLCQSISPSAASALSFDACTIFQAVLRALGFKPSSSDLGIDVRSATPPYL